MINWNPGLRSIRMRNDAHACIHVLTETFIPVCAHIYIYIYIYVCVTSSLRISRRYVASTTPVAFFYRVTHYSWATVGRPYVTNRPPYGYKVITTERKGSSNAPVHVWPCVRINDRWTGLHKCRRGLNATNARIHTHVYTIPFNF